MVSPEIIEKIKAVVDSSRNICVFTGAGISCPSGIPDFRSADGLYSRKYSQKYSPEEMISHSFFETRCEEFFEFYKSKMIYPSALPNKAHEYFASLEKSGKHVSVVTQNIDGLHQMAGSTDVIELHGSIRRNRCMKCGKSFDLSYIVNSVGVPRCGSDNAVIKPDVVLYEEPLDEAVVNSAFRAISTADTMFVVGSSLAVYPANTFIHYFKGENLILINKTKTQADILADIVVSDDIIIVVEQLEKSRQ